MEIKEIIKKVYPLSDTSVRILEDITSVKQIRQSDLFIRKGMPDNYEYFLIDGICRSFLHDPEGKEVTIDFFTKGSVISPYITRTNEKVSNKNFQALTDIKLGLFDAEVFLNLMVENLEIREFGNMVLKMELQNKVDKEINMASLTARERLINFRKRYPLLENLIPHPAIASYLGITNISLSRLRKDLLG